MNQFKFLILGLLGLKFGLISSQPVNPADDFQDTEVGLPPNQRYPSVQNDEISQEDNYERKPRLRSRINPNYLSGLTSPPIPQIPIQFNNPARPNQSSQQDSSSIGMKLPSSSLQEFDYEYKYTQLLIDKLWDHLLQRESDEHIRILLLNERQNLERIVKFRRSKN